MIFPSDKVRKDGENIVLRDWEAMKTEDRADGRRKRRRRAVALQKCGGCCVCWPLSLSALYTGNLCALARFLSFRCLSRDYLIFLQIREMIAKI